MRLEGVRATRALVAVGSIVGLALVALVSSAGAGIPQLAAPLTVVKTVSGPVPAGTTFTATIQCDGNIIDTGDDSSDTATVTFDAAGQPTSPDTVGFVEGGECTVTETVTGGAATTTYSCEGSAPVGSESEGEFSAAQVEPDPVVCATSGPGPITVNIFSEAQQGVVTITNTFSTPTPTPQPAAQVVAQPAFTG
jgi:hypothetical protein